MEMQLSYCTMFDSNYLDKGLVMMESLRKYSDSRIYVLAMDSECFTVLEKEKRKDIIPVALESVEAFFPRLLSVKAARTKAEYCWTCTADLVLYLLEHYQEKCCTYIDADMCFYDNPDTLVMQMIQKKKSVQLIRHGFKMDYYGRKQMESYGKYCVEFNTFRNDADGRRVVRDWAEKTLECCTQDNLSGQFGDQVYLNDWTEKYTCVNVLEHDGAGVAPWNINRYRLLQAGGEHWRLLADKKKEVPLFFYHFQGMKFIRDDCIDIGVCRQYWKTDARLIEALYGDYINRIEASRAYLREQYGIRPRISAHPAYGRRQTFAEKMAIWRKGKYSFLFAWNILTGKCKYALNHKKDLFYI